MWALSLLFQATMPVPLLPCCPHRHRLLFLWNWNSFFYTLPWSRYFYHSCRKIETSTRMPVTLKPPKTSHHQKSGQGRVNPRNKKARKEAGGGDWAAIWFDLEVSLTGSWLECSLSTVAWAEGTSREAWGIIIPNPGHSLCFLAWYDVRCHTPLPPWTLSWWTETSETAKISLCCHKQVLRVLYEVHQFSCRSQVRCRGTEARRLSNLCLNHREDQRQHGVVQCFLSLLEACVGFDWHCCCRERPGL